MCFPSLAQCRLPDRPVNSPVIYLSDLDLMRGSRYRLLSPSYRLLQVDAANLKQSRVGYFLGLSGMFNDDDEGSYMLSENSIWGFPRQLARRFMI
jgi:hypothetical protein